MAVRELTSQLQRALEQWQRDVLEPFLQAYPERPEEHYRTDNGITMQRVYTPLDLPEDFDYERDLGFPGAFPFTRGIVPNGYRSRHHVIKMYSGLGSPEHTNRRFRKLLEWGAEEIQIAADLPTQVGYDSDHIMATGEVGRTGTAICSLRDMEVVFDGIPLNSLQRVGILGNAIGPIALAWFIALGEKQGLSINDYVVDLQNDPLKEYVARGTQIFPVEAAVRMACDVVEWCARHAPHWRPMDLCVNHLNAAGAGSSWGTAFALANGLAYIDELLRRGLSIDEIAPLLAVFADEREEFFVAVANLRALRRIWARMMRDRFGAKDPRSMALEITAYAHGRETRAEPLNNLARIAFGCLAYYMGGVQTLYNASFDEALSTPSDLAALLAIRMQQILREEHGFFQSADPLGGSYLVESLTFRCEADILKALQEIEARGGAIACIRNGFTRSIIADGAIRRQQRTNEGARVMVGVNKYRSTETEPQASAYRPDEDAEAIQRARLAKLRAERDAARVRRALEDVRDAARGKDNLVPPVLEAVKAEATLGEICDVLRDVFGEFEPDTSY